MEIVEKKAPSFEERRLNKIKMRFVINPQRCSCCKKKYALEFMWYTHRYLRRYSSDSFNHEITGDAFNYYCTRCMPSRNDVLKEAYNDENLAGFYPFDINGRGREDFEKHKNKARYNKSKAIHIDVLV